MKFTGWEMTPTQKILSRSQQKAQVRPDEKNQRWYYLSKLNNQEDKLQCILLSQDILHPETKAYMEKLRASSQTHTHYSNYCNREV